ncbi:dead box atp-dependent rna helicase-like protein 2 [Dermatophagoides farinae]|uniref:ATP-dependent RNA helicase n=1 Tax=Dermatophagoides farinae TaxID=6954 RepID=A0A9D4P7Q4_DERFA|nr:dead box atp-dependent rna helicase-like protein 2 [Dermatophagoides farinae]
MDDFKQLGISNWLCKALKSLGITSASNIQREAIPVILSSKRPNVFACSRTGSGKTLAFVLPIIETLVREPRPYYSLILSPTRELANQIYEMIKALTVNTFSVKTLLIIGGQNQEEEQGLWFGKPNIVVATPGRLLDYFTNPDQLISPGFCHQLKGILKFFDDIAENETTTKHRRQTLLFSATLTHALEKLQEIITKKDNDIKPVIINLLPAIDDVKTELATNSSLDQRYLLCPEAIKVVYLVECILDIKFKQLIIFCQTKKEANLIHKVLLSLGFDGPEFNLNPVLLNSNLKQNLRFAALETFRSLKSKILVTTDIANRGLDLPQVDLVINFNCPKSPIIYIHRVGRTCRKPDFRYEQQPNIEQTDDDDDDDYNEDDTDDEQNRKRKLYELFKSIESYIGIKMESQEVDEKNVTQIIKQTAIAIKEAQIRIDQETQESSRYQNIKQNKTMKRQKLK